MMFNIETKKLDNNDATEKNNFNSSIILLSFNFLLHIQIEQNHSQLIDFH